jgi:menaquinone-dependent protoporphyrinogen oxidase
VKVLVIAASRHGATTEIAATIGAALATAGHAVTVEHPEGVASVAGYDAVVVGSAVYMGHWLEAARELVEREKVALERVPVWLFSSGPVGDPPKPVEEAVDELPLVELVGARGHRTFAGHLQKTGLGFSEKAIVAAVRAPEGDFRPWADIRAWAREIATALEVVHDPA